MECQTNLSLAQAPDTSYNFLCRQGDRPLTWPASVIRLYDYGLGALQSVALAVALAQWESAAHFSVSFVGDAGSADVTLTSAPLPSSQPGFDEDGYTTVLYHCVPTCVFYHADVVLSSTAGLTQTDWVSTVLHELGHVAGLNHVAVKGDVMYPYLTLTSPVLYSAGERTGLQILASERGA